MKYQLASESIEQRLNAEEKLDLLRFALFICDRWRFVSASCLLAILLAAGGSLLIPKRYTTTATLLIEPPAGNDPRGATAISQIYLESLKTYEKFASSDTLFAKALQRSGMRQNFLGISLEALKRQVLRVSKPRDTKVLEISITLRDARAAQALAQAMAQETVQLSTSLDQLSQQDLTAEVRTQFEKAAARLERANRASDEFFTKSPVATLENQVKNATEENLKIQNALAEANVDLADYESRLQSRTGSKTDPKELTFVREQIAASRARLKRFEKEDQDLNKFIAVQGSVLEKRKHERELLDAERQIAKGQYELAAGRRNDTLASAAFRTERLELIDPGAVPEKPSSPNIALNIVVAFFLALIASLSFLALRYGTYRLRHVSESRSYSTVA